MLKKIKTLSLLLLSIILVCFSVGCKSEPNPVSQQPKEKKTYMVAFDVQGYGNSISPFTVEEGSCINKPSDPVSDIMDFVGWYKESDCINLWNFETDKVISSTILYAKWIAKSFMYTLHPNNSDPDIIGTYAYGMGFTLPTNIVKAGMYFGGWYNNSSFSGDSVTEISASDFGNKEFWLKWNENPTLKWVLNGGTVTTDGYPAMYDTEVEIEPSATITAPVVEKTGYSFNGWNPTVPAVMPAANVTYEAQWTAKEYTVTLDKNGGDTNGSVKYTYNASTKTDLTAPTRADWTLLGLYAENTCATKVANADGSLLANITGYTDSNGNWIKDDATVTLYAKWASNTTVVTLNKNGGDIDGSITYFYNSSERSALSLPTRAGYSLAGFYVESGCITKIANADGSLIPNKTGYTDADGKWINGNATITLYTGWATATYAVILDKNNTDVTGTANGGIRYTYNASTKSDFTIPARIGYTVEGFYAEAGCITKVANADGSLLSGISDFTDTSGNWIKIGSAITLYTKWKANEYSIIYKDIGNNTFTGTHEGGTAPTVHKYGTPTTLKSATKENCVFVGWYTNSDCSGNAITSIGATDYTAYSTEADKVITLYARWAGIFTVNSSGKKVAFTSGNVQYQASTDTWRFAEHQYDYIGNSGGNVTVTGRDTQEAWIDMFGWGATNTRTGNGNVNGASAYSLSAEIGDYKTESVASTSEKLTIENRADWGYCFGGAESKFRTLTGGPGGEWEWLLGPSDRPYAGTNCRRTNISGFYSSSFARYAKVKVSGYADIVCGLLIFPDVFTWNTDTMGTAPSKVNEPEANWSNAPVYTQAQFTAMEAAGCAFLPAAGYSNSHYSVSYANIYGIYWSNTSHDSYITNAFGMLFDGQSATDNFVNPSTSHPSRSSGNSIRLVWDIE